MIKTKLRIIADPRMVNDSTLMTALSEWNWFVNSKKFLWFVLFKKKRWVAYGALSLYDSSTVYFGPDFVVEPARGHRLQQKLIKKREKWARKQGYKVVLVVVEPGNVSSANNYIRCGYALREAWLGFGQNDKYLWFTKEL